MKKNLFLLIVLMASFLHSEVIEYSWDTLLIATNVAYPSILPFVLANEMITGTITEPLTVNYSYRLKSYIETNWTGGDIYKSLQKLKKAHPISASIPDKIVTDITLEEQDVFYSSLRVVQPLFLGGRVYYRHRQAKVGEKMALNRYRQAKIAIVHDTLVTYFLFCHAKTLFATLKDSQERIQAIEDLAKTRMEKANPAVKNEARAPTEFWRAKVFRLMMSEKAKEAENGIENTMIALRALIGNSPYIKTQLSKIDFQQFQFKNNGFALRTCFKEI